MDELEENFRSMLKSVVIKVIIVLVIKIVEYSEMVLFFEISKKIREFFVLEENEIYGFGFFFFRSDIVKFILNINIEFLVVFIFWRFGSFELLVGYLG